MELTIMKRRTFIGGVAAVALADDMVRGAMPEIHPLDVCVPFNLGSYEILPLGA